MFKYDEQSPSLRFDLASGKKVKIMLIDTTQQGRLRLLFPRSQLMRTSFDRKAKNLRTAIRKSKNNVRQSGVNKMRNAENKMRNGICGMHVIGRRR